MSDPSDDQFEAEAIDEDVIDGAPFPPDRPLGVADALARDITIPGEEVQDSLAERIAREEPDLAPVEGGDVDLPYELIEGDTDLEGERAEADDDDVVLSESVGAGRDDRPAEELALHLEGPDPDDETITEILERNEQQRQ